MGWQKLSRCTVCYNHTPFLCSTVYLTSSIIPVATVFVCLGFGGWGVISSFVLFISLLFFLGGGGRRGISLWIFKILFVWLLLGFFLFCYANSTISDEHFNNGFTCMWTKRVVLVLWIINCCFSKHICWNLLQHQLLNS